MEYSEGNNKLPVLAIFLEAITLPTKHAAALLRLGFPFIIIATIGIIYSSLKIDQGNEIIVGDAAGYIWFVLYAATLIMAVVGCHRIFLLNADGASSTKVLRWSGRETQYILFWVFIGLAAGVVIVPIFLVLLPPLIAFTNNLSENNALLIVGTSVLSIPAYYLVSRWSLVLPATATDSLDKTLAWSWSLSKNNEWRLTLLIGVLPFFTDLFFELLPEFESILYSLFVGFTWLIVCVIEVGLLSLSYAYLSKMAIDSSPEAH